MNIMNILKKRYYNFVWRYFSVTFVFTLSEGKSIVLFLRLHNLPLCFKSCSLLLDTSISIYRLNNLIYLWQAKVVLVWRWFHQYFIFIQSSVYNITIKESRFFEFFQKKYIRFKFRCLVQILYGSGCFCLFLLQFMVLVMFILWRPCCNWWYDKLKRKLCSFLCYLIWVHFVIPY